MYLTVCINYCKHASHTYYVYANCAPSHVTHTMTRIGLLLRVDEYEAHHFGHFGNEQSYVIADVKCFTFAPFL